MKTKNPMSESVSGVKGSAEGVFRKGYISLSPADIGLGNVDNTADSEKSVKYANSAKYSDWTWFRMNKTNSGVALNTDNNVMNICAWQTQIRNKANDAWSPIYASTFSQQSSQRYKENIEDMSEEFARNLLKIRMVRFDYKNKLEYGDMANGCSGVIAEEVAEVQQWGVVKDAEGVVDGVDYSKFVPQLIKLCQMQQREIDALKEKAESVAGFA